ncbi:MAG: type II toxin-antitoxin system VapC family toxin [Opitutales bacterium]
MDTNVLVRLLTADDPKQHAQARAWFAHRRIVLPVTVLLETEWVLRAAYGYSQSAIHDAFTRILETPHIQVTDRDAVLRALPAYALGCDWADALHAALLPPATQECITFDRAFLRHAQKHPDSFPVPIRAASTTPRTPPP